MLPEGGCGAAGPPAWVNPRVNAHPLPAGKLRYANNSNYKNDVMIRKEVRAARLGPAVPAKGAVGWVRVGWRGRGAVGRAVLISLPNVVSRLMCTRV